MTGLVTQLWEAEKNLVLLVFFIIQSGREIVMNARIAKIKKHFRDNYKTYIGAVVGLAAGVAAGLVIVSKINAAKEKQGNPQLVLQEREMTSAEVIAEGESLRKEIDELISSEVAKAKKNEEDVRDLIALEDAAL
jgi:hypothetical protein